jgi:hypothetical protein
MLVLPVVIYYFVLSNKANFIDWGLAITIEP